MKQYILLVVLLAISFTGFSQSKTTTTTNTSEFVSIKKAEAVAPKKVRATPKAKYLKINYKKSNDIISIKAYRKSLKDKLRREKLC